MKPGAVESLSRRLGMICHVLTGSDYKLTKAEVLEKILLDGEGNQKPLSVFPPLVVMYFTDIGGT